MLHAGVRRTVVIHWAMPEETETGSPASTVEPLDLHARHPDGYSPAADGVTQRASDQVPGPAHLY